MSSILYTYFLDLVACANGFPAHFGFERFLNGVRHDVAEMLCCFPPLLYLQRNDRAAVERLRIFVAVASVCLCDVTALSRSIYNI